MSKHAIIIIKDELGNYLQYFDEKWDSYLFLNCKVEDNAAEPIISYIHDVFQIENRQISCEFLGEKIHKKYSYSHKTEKEYHHYFFKVTIPISNFLKQKEFVYNDTMYRWYSTDELEKDERIMLVNKDIIEYVHSFSL